MSRLLLKDPAVLCFDEAVSETDQKSTSDQLLLIAIFQTSALDTHTEQNLLQNINSVLKDHKRTSIFIAHRLRTIYDSDVIIVLDNGRVKETGNHQELIGRGGLYADLWSSKLELLEIFYSTKSYICTLANRLWTLLAQEMLFDDEKDQVE